MTIRLSPVDGGTLVELFHHGFEALGDDAAENHRGFEGGWTMRQLEALRERGEIDRCSRRWPTRLGERSSSCSASGSHDQPARSRRPSGTISRPAVSKHLRVLREAASCARRTEAARTTTRCTLRPLADVQRGWLEQFVPSGSRASNGSSAKRRIDGTVRSGRPVLCHRTRRRRRIR